MQTRALNSEKPSSIIYRFDDDPRLTTPTSMTISDCTQVAKLCKRCEVLEISHQTLYESLPIKDVKDWELSLDWELDGIWPFVRDDCEQMGKLCDFCSHLSSLLLPYWLCRELEIMKEQRIRITISYVVQRTMSDKLRLKCLRVRMSAEGNSNT